MGFWAQLLNAKTPRRVGLVAASVFVFLYLYSVENIVVAPGLDLAAGREVPSVVPLPDWSSKIWKPIAPFVWEPIVAFYIGKSVVIYFSLPNLLFAVLLGIMVGLNITVALVRAQMADGKGGGGVVGGFLASTPTLLTGFTCCVPTLVIALGSLAAGFTVAAVTVAPYLVPFAILALSLNLLWGLRRLSCALKRR